MPSRKEIWLWSLLTAVVLLIILFFGLRQKWLPQTASVELIPKEKTLLFKRNSIAFIDDLKIDQTAHINNALTIEMAVMAESIYPLGFSSLMMLHAGDDNRQLIIGQWESSIIVMNGDDYEHARKIPRISVNAVLGTKKVTFVTVTADKTGTRLYVDGKIAANARKWQLKVPTHPLHKLRMVLGNSVTQKNNWHGKLYWFGLYGSAFSQQKVKINYEAWSHGSMIHFDPKDEPIVLYDFAEQKGHTIPDLSGNNRSLTLPLQPIVLEKKILSTSARDIKFNVPFFVDVVLNFFGFVPLGIAFSGLRNAMTMKPKKSVQFIIFLICFVISLGIELQQAWMPSRDSSLQDLVLNTMGAALGIWLFEKAIRKGWLRSIIP